MSKVQKLARVKVYSSDNESSI